MGVVDAYLESVVHDGAAPLWLTFMVAVLLGLRHATDPDHLAAVSTLLLRDRSNSKEATQVGISWGLGHGATMLLLGLPVVLFAVQFPPGVYKAAEAVVGLIIIYYSVRLAGLYMTGAFHFHGTRRPHPHVDTLTVNSTRRKAFGVGVVHGVGGSYGGALLVLATFGTVAGAAAGLVVFTSASVFSMMLVTWLFAKMVTNHKYMHIVNFCLPLFAVGSFVFGLLYLQEALR